MFTEQIRGVHFENYNDEYLLIFVIPVRWSGTAQDY